MRLLGHLWHRFGERYPTVRFVTAMVPLVILLIAANNQRQNEQRRRADAQFHRSQVLAQRKFEQAIHIAIAQGSYSTNRSVCGWRGFLVPTLTDKRIPQKRRHQIAVFLESQVTVPSDFKCSTLPKKPPKPPKPPPTP